MKKSTTFSLPLQWICNQRSNSGAKSKLTFVGLILLVFVMLPLQQAKAGYFYEFTDYFTVTGSTCNGWLDIKIIGLNKDGNNDRMEDCTLKYSDDNGLTYKELLSFYVTSQDLVGSFTNKTNGLNFANGTIVAPPSPYFSYTGLQAYLKVKWYYPNSLIGKSLKFRIEGKWFRNYAASSGKAHDEFTGDYVVSNVVKNVRTVSVPVYNPSPTFTLTPGVNGKYKFAWTGASALVSKFEFYNDAAYTNLAGTVNGTTDAGSDSVKLGGFNANNTYYVKQIYVTPSAESGFSTIFEKQIPTTVNNVGFQFPENVKIVYSPANENIELKWSKGNSGGAQVKYYIKRNGVLISPVEGLTEFAFIDFKDTPITHWSNYTYQVYAVPVTAGWAKENILPELSYSEVVSTSPTEPKFGGYNIEAHPTNGTIKPYIEISWDKNEWVAQNTVKLYHRISTSANLSLLKVMDPGAEFCIDEDVKDNSKHYYQLEVNVFGHIFKSPIISKSVIKYVAFKSIKASKNTIGDRIQLNWEIDRLDLCDRFEIYRSFTKDSMGVDVQTTPEMVKQFSAQTVFNSWDDMTTAPGVVYQYQIKAYKKGSDNELRVSDSKTDIGFRMPSGTVTGRITYGGGTAVGNVSLYVNSSSSDNNLLYKSLKFDADTSQVANIALTKAQHGCITKGFSFQSWVTASRSKVYTPVIEVSKEYSIGLRNDSVLAFLGSTMNLNSPALKCKLDSSINENNYFHLTVTYDTNDSLKVFLNGIPKKSAFAKFAHVSTCLFVDEVLDDSTGRVITNRTKSYLCKKTNPAQANVGAFSGNIDDVRLWSRAITATEVASNFNRYLGGNESGLIGYWPLDEGINSNAFDCSKTNQSYNEHHIKLTNVYTSSVVPSKEQLSIKGVTDVDGNYIIRGIPFSGDGSTFSIQPILGTHKFEPTQQVCYISQTSLVHNGQNFADKSSFPIKIRVNYSNTGYPVPGVMFYVDETPCSMENRLVTTSAQLTYDNTRKGEFKTIDVGECVIDVPIGEHYIRAELSGHTFENKGRWPAAGKMVFNENSVKIIDFADTTLITIVGRVVGGEIENSYPIGFKNSEPDINHSSHANIGKAKITMEPSIYKKYNLNNDTIFDKIQTLSIAETKKFGSISKYLKNSSIVEVITDPSTGEYMVELPPIEWDIISVKTSTNSSYTYDNDIIKDVQSFKTSTMISSFDTARIVETNKLDSFFYNVKKSFVYQAPINIEVRQVKADRSLGTAFGESEWNISAPNTANEVRKLYTPAVTPDSVKYIYGKDAKEYPNGKPIFIQSKVYGFNIYAYESYTHPEGLFKEFSKVPLAGAIVNVKNQIGILQKKIEPDVNDTIATHVMKLDKNGQINYAFKAGFPNLANVNSGLSMTISVKNGTAPAQFWNEMGDFRGIVIGCEPIAGTNYVTQGPSALLAVLHDPPGSNSYAYMESGTTLSYSFVDKDIKSRNFSATTSISSGPKIETATGFGFMVLSKIASDDNVKLGAEGEWSSFTGDTEGKTITTKERIQTSASPNFVGSNADVYIGTSTNVYYCDSRYLNIKKEGLKIDTVSSSSISGATDFRFSQNEIVTAQIPKWKAILRQLLHYVPLSSPDTALAYFQRKADSDKINYYYTSINPSANNFGKELYKVVRPKNIKNNCDTIEVIVNAIASWEKIISDNEEGKKNAATNSYYSKGNISFDAGSTVDRSYTYVTSNGETSGESNINRAIVGTNFGFSINSVGFAVDLCVQKGGGTSDETNTGTTTSTTFGYVLSDPDADNRFAVDVYKNKLLDKDADELEDITDDYADNCLKSYIFELVGGQSSCPYEAADSTLYYKVNNKSVKLANGTQPLDAPYIMVKTPDKSDIPNGKDATFALELGNQSIVQSPRAYMLSVVDESNKYGAVLSVDGTPLTGGRIFYVTPGQILTKTLTLHQTRLDVLDYQDIKLKFSSICDTTIYKIQKINVTYVPSCSDLEIALDRQIINVKDTGALQVTFKNFNQEYKNFLGIQLQYKMDGDTQWKSILYAKDVNAQGRLNSMNLTSSLIPNVGNTYVSSFSKPLSFRGLNDGNYTIRAKTLCDNGTQIPIYNMTEEYKVIKDVESPRSMGVPSPANGILTPETEISVTFNENIQTTKLIPANFEVKGVLNNAAMQHAEGVAFDGSSKSQAFTESTISLQNNSFAIEAWVRPDVDCPDFGNLFTIGTGVNKVALNMKQTAIEVRVNDALIATRNIEDITIPDWQYVSLWYDASRQRIGVNLLRSASSDTISSHLTSPISPEGRLLVGTGFKGDIHQVAVWSENRKINDLKDMNSVKTGNENNLIGYWPMNEATGTIAVDKVRNRNMIVNSSWFVEPNGKATVYNGINQSTCIKSDSIPFTVKDNFSLEFWFKGKSQTNATMFSCGRGEKDVNVAEKLSVGFNSNGELCLNTNSNSFVVPNAIVLDTLWHHFAMSVSRNSYTNVYIDGLQKLQLSSTKIGGMASDSIALGACRYTDSVLVSSKYNYIKKLEQYFNGSLDEVRIWNSTLTADNIRLDMHSRLIGNEIGLVSYYPFEQTTTGSIAAYSLKDFARKKDIYAKSTALETANTPGIKIPRTKEDVSYSYTASDNKIVFNIDAPLAKTENCTLEFAIKNVYDMNGNLLSSPIKWTAFVNNNRLNWETEQISITKEVLETSSFKATIVNNSGKYENFVIDGLPGWLSVNKSSGKLNPLEKMELIFTVDVATNIGSYESGITLTGNNGIEEMLPVSLKVTGPRPDWAVNPYDFSSSMSITGQIKIENVFQEDTGDMLAAFIGTRCVGIAHPQFNKKQNCYIMYMDVYGSDADESAKPLVKFSLWDAGTGRIYPDVDVLVDNTNTVTTINYIADAMIGSIDSTQIFNATDKIEQQLSLKQGWNWVSTNVVNTTSPLLSQFETGMEDAGIQIKSRNKGFTNYASGSWDGSLTVMDQISMYMIKTNQAKTVKLVGAMAKPADASNKIMIDSLWNWIGYTPQFVAPVGVALSNVNPREGDQVKGQVGFATYTGGAWNGSLQYMTPGLGYMYYSKNKKAGFNYPSQYLGASRMMRLENENSSLKWEASISKYQQSMTITAVASIDEMEVTNSDLQLGVFINNECRGSIALKYVESYNRYFAYLTIWGNPEDVNKKITFKSFNQTTDKELISNDMSLTYIPNEIVGSTVSPYVVKISSIASGIYELDKDMTNIYPNPVVNTLHFNYNPNEIDLFEIVDCTGRILNYTSTINKNSVNVDGLVPGIYTLRVTYKGENYVHRFIKK